jgi:hypothetical protein
MPTLKIDFNCMCLYVTNGEPSVVHVLMPSTSGHGNHHQHVVRMVYRDRGGQIEFKEMEGWALSVRRGASGPGEEPASAVELRKQKPVVNLTDFTGRQVDQELVTGSGGGKIVSRVTVRGGAIEEVACQEQRWELGSHQGVMADQVTWRVDDVPMELDWTSLGAEGEVPLASLADVMPEDEEGEVYHVYVYHVLEQDLPTDLPPSREETTLFADDIMTHFPMYYPLLNGVRMTAELKPKLIDENPDDDDGGEPSGVYLCKSAQALTM